MYKNALEKINKFYNLDLDKSPQADEIFDVLNETVCFDSAAIFYLAPNLLSFEFGKNYNNVKNVKISETLSKKLYDINQTNITKDIKNTLQTDNYLAAERLVLKGAVLGIIVISRKNSIFTSEEKNILKTCAHIISALIKDFEFSKIVKLQLQTMEQGLFKSRNTLEQVKKQNKKIKADEKLQSQFLANISHDLRTPLNSIIGFSDALANNCFGNLNDKQAVYVNEIKAAGINLLQMINEILDITKLESNTIRLNLSETDITALINEVCNTLSPLFEKKELNIIKITEPDTYIKADSLKLQQVLMNILGNAIKYSPQKGSITIQTFKTQQTLSISIKDEGTGIAEKYHKKIFNKFFQVPNSNTSEPSTGLGLTIAKEFIKLHNGKIEIKSKTGKGSEFIITIPENYEK